MSLLAENMMIFIGASNHSCHGNGSSGRVLSIIENSGGNFTCYLAERDAQCGSYEMEVNCCSIVNADIHILFWTDSMTECHECQHERAVVIKNQKSRYSVIVMTDGNVTRSVPSLLNLYPQIYMDDNFEEELLEAIKATANKVLIHASQDSHLDYIPCPTCHACYHQDERHICRHDFIKCRNSGCGASFKRKYVSAHKGECQFENIPCKNSKCGKMIIRQNMETHSESCKYETVQCLNRQCSAEFCRKNAERHHKKCMFTASIRCAWCKKHFCGYEYRHHKNNCSVKISKKQKLIRQRQEANGTLMFSMLGK